MAKIYKFLYHTLLMSALFVSSSASSQYVKFPLDSAVWRVNYYNFQGCPPGPQPNAIYQYTYDGDTVINGMIYSKVYSSGISNCLTLGFCGSLRDDTLNKKVFFIFSDSTSEQVLYDFNLNVGDTVHDIYNIGWIHTVNSIDTVIYGGLSRKRIEYTFTDGTRNGPFIVEGIGNVGGLLAPLEAPQAGFEMTCFSFRGVPIYPDSSANCILINNVSDTEKNKISVSISPLPITEVSYVTLENGQAKYAEVIDVFGKFVNHFNCENNKIVLRRIDFSAGIYFCKIISTINEVVIVKIIVL